MRLGSLPPAGEAVRLSALVGGGAAPVDVASVLARQLGAERVTLHASGREALRFALAHLAATSGRDELIVPAYTCFSVPAAAVAAGLRVRLVDVDTRGWIDRDSLAHLPRDRAVAVLVSNLFGVPEDLRGVRALADEAGALVIDDAAQTLGASGPEGPVGGRTPLGLLSFGRGKPLSALGGGALVWGSGVAVPDAPPAPEPAALGAAVRGAAWNAALRPGLFRVLQSIPALGIGETRYDPAFRRGPIDAASLRLAAAALAGLQAHTRERRGRALELAARIEAETRFTPLLAVPASAGVYPRLALVAPTAAARDAALAALTGLGATRLYPSALDGVPALAPHIVTAPPCPGARDLAARVLTLPTHAGLRPRLQDALLAALAGSH